MNSLIILEGDWIEQLKTLPDESVHCCVTSPPYWGLRDYGVPGQLGLEKTPEEYVAKLVEGFREVRRVLREDGTLWLNLGDCYYNYRTGYNGALNKQSFHKGPNGKPVDHEVGLARRGLRQSGLKEKDLVGVPWRVAFALQADGWWLRSDIIWHKPNPMPESVTDRPTKAHEYIFLLTKADRYFYDAEAIKEPTITDDIRKPFCPGQVDNRGNGHDRGGGKPTDRDPGSRNRRTVWTVPSQAYPESHFATFPEDLIKPCILAGTSAKGCCPKCGAPWKRVLEITREQTRPGNQIKYDESRNDAGRNGRVCVTDSKTIDWQPTCNCSKAPMFYDNPPMPCTVIDPFFGSGTVGQVSLELGRWCIGIELNPEYIELARRRCDVTPGLALA